MWGSAPPARGAPIVAARGAGQFTFYVSCDVNLQVRVKVSELQGLLPSQRAQLPVAGAGPHAPSLLPAHGAPLGHDATWPELAAPAPAAGAGGGGGDAYGSSTTSGSSGTSSLYVTARLVSCGDTMGLEANTAYAQPADPPSSSGAAAGCGGGGGWAATARWDEWLTFCIKAILKLPPNKPLSAAEKELLWRFRASLTADTRALTKFLKCIDWGDALEAKQAGRGGEGD
ncbi:Phosphatidylinositol 3-kinase, nodule isoform, partial [Tetrabaena socialis]